jgi:hypothetical protein
MAVGYIADFQRSLLLPSPESKCMEGEKRGRERVGGGGEREREGIRLQSRMRLLNVLKIKKKRDSTFLSNAARYQNEHRFV